MIPESVIYGHINVDNTSLINKCNMLSENPNIARKQTLLFPGTINSHFRNLKNSNDQFLEERNPHRWEEWKEVQNEIEDIVPFFSIETSWFNVMPINSEIKMHNHPYSSKSVFVYYVNSSLDHPSIDFLINYKRVSIFPVSGDWLMFPNSLWHGVKLNSSTENRISISINFNQ
jgi:hypothetical protein